MNNKIVLLDGAMGTALWEKVENKEPVWTNNILHPDLVCQVHQDMIDAGAQIILSNTFGGNRPSVKRSVYSVEEIMRSGMEIAKSAAKGKAKVLLDVGPLTGLLEPYGDIEEDEAEEIYDEMLSFGMKEQPDGVLLETFIDLNMLMIAVRCVRKKYDVPLFCSMSFSGGQRTIMGNSVEDMVKALTPYQTEAVGVNCSAGPAETFPVLKQFRDYTDSPLWFKPNAGRPIMINGEAKAPYSPEQFARDMQGAVDFGVSYLGGCCGTTAAHIKALQGALPPAPLQGC